MEILNFNDNKAKDIIACEEVLALPTETVYGLGIKWDSPLAYERLCQVKNRRPDKAIAIMVGDKFDLDKYFELTADAKKVIQTFLPGPLTCLVKARENTPYQSHLGTFIAGIRIPAKKELLNFLNELSYPLQVTSANISGEQALYDFEKVYQTFNNTSHIKGIIKGSCQSGTPTTVVDLTSDEIKVIRQGQITKEEIEKVIKR